MMFWWHKRLMRHFEILRSLLIFLVSIYLGMTIWLIGYEWRRPIQRASGSLRSLRPRSASDGVLGEPGGWFGCGRAHVADDRLREDGCGRECKSALVYEHHRSTDA